MKYKSQKGFTLIELLIVIALLGTLAVALLAALDPFEQLKKGTDTGIRNTVTELQASMIRYYAVKGQMPWCTNAACTTFSDATAGVAANFTTPVAMVGLPNMVAAIENTGELKTGFITLAGPAAANSIKVFGTGAVGANPAVTVCYTPTAKSFMSDPNTKYEIASGVLQVAPSGSLCRGQDPTSIRTDCLWCIQ